jgi:predicted ATPase
MAMADEEFIGRVRECAQLALPAAEALAGHGSVVLLAGEAGVGKTTLVRRVLAGSDLTVLEGFATAGGASPFGPLVEALRAYLRSADGLTH